MTADEAIENLQNQVKYQYSATPTKDGDAIKLGFEALKREKRNRKDPDFVLVGLLPGETAEADPPQS